MFFQKDYSTYLVSILDNETTWEIQVDLNDTPESDTWFLLIDKWVAWKEENIFYHRKVWNSVFFYWVNRSNPVTHDINASVLLANAIDAMNYLAQIAQEQFYVFKKTVSEVIITWWKVYESWEQITVAEVDTSDWNANQILTVNSTNYVYVESWVIYISGTEDTTKYIIAEIIVDASWNVTSFTNEKPFSFKWVQWIQGEQWIQWEQGIQWDVWPIGATWPQGIQWEQWDMWVQWNIWIDWPQWIQWVAWPQWPEWVQWDTWIQWPQWLVWDDGPQWDEWIKWDPWADIVWRWEFEMVTTYDILDAVEYEWSSYICTLWTIWHIPTDVTYWDVMAEKWDIWETWPEWPEWPAGPQWIQWPSWLVWLWLWVYNAWTTYIVSDLVSYDWASYICILSSTWNLPTNLTYWDLVSDKWDQWIQGIQGIQWLTWPQWLTWDKWDQWDRWLSWQWVYNPVTTYIIDDAVSYNWSSYINILWWTWDLPTDIIHWQLIAEKWVDWAWTWDMLAANNLSDLGDIPTAKTNLWLENVDNTADIDKPVDCWVY